MSQDNEIDCRFHTKTDGSYWVNDARGIPLARVCEKCEDEKLAKFRPEVLTDSNYAANEEIEPDDWAGERDQERQFSEYLEHRAGAYGRDDQDWGD